LLGDQARNRATNAQSTAIAKREWAEAELYYGKALEIDWRLPEIWVQYGHTLREQHKFADADRAYRAARHLFFYELSDTYLHLGHLYKQEVEEKQSRAIEHSLAQGRRMYQTAAILYPPDPRPLEGLSDLESVEDRRSPSAGEQTGAGPNLTRSVADGSRGEARTESELREGLPSEELVKKILAEDVPEAIAPGDYTDKSLPPISPRAKRILDRVYATAANLRPPVPGTGKQTDANARRGLTLNDKGVFVGLRLTEQDVRKQKVNDG